MAVLERENNQHLALLEEKAVTTESLQTLGWSVHEAWRYETSCTWRWSTRATLL